MKNRKEREIMTKREQAEIILRELDKEYGIPSYMEDDAIRGIMAGLTQIEKQEGATEEGWQIGECLA